MKLNLKSIQTENCSDTKSKKKKKFTFKIGFVICGHLVIVIKKLNFVIPVSIFAV